MNFGDFSRYQSWPSIFSPEVQRLVPPPVDSFSSSDEIQKHLSATIPAEDNTTSEQQTLSFSPRVPDDHPSSWHHAFTLPPLVTTLRLLPPTTASNATTSSTPEADTRTTEWGSEHQYMQQFNTAIAELAAIINSTGDNHDNATTATNYPPIHLIKAIIFKTILCLYQKIKSCNN